MESNEELVQYLVDFNFLKSKRIIEAFRKVDRSHFVLPSQKGVAFEDTPLPTFGVQTISAPSVVAIMTEALDLPIGGKVFEVGTGSGYQTAIVAEIVGPTGKVISTEIVPELCDYSRMKIEKLGLKNVELVCADGSGGKPGEAPFDGILVTCGAPSVPGPLFEQLKEGGRMVIPVGESFVQELLLVEKKGGKQVVRDVIPVMFVPMKGKFGFK